MEIIDENMKNEILKGFELYKKVQKQKYNEIEDYTKENLKQFRQILGNFTDKIFEDFVRIGKFGMWQNSGNFTKYMWNKIMP